nr:MAG TPA: Bacteriocin subtilosin A [Caudoviricetes sp.]
MFIYLLSAAFCKIGCIYEIKHITPIPDFEHT